MGRHRPASFISYICGELNPCRSLVPRGSRASARILARRSASPPMSCTTSYFFGTISGVSMFFDSSFE